MNRLRELGGGWLRWPGWRVVPRPGQQPFQDPEKIPTRKNTLIVYKAESECRRCPDSMTYIVYKAKSECHRCPDSMSPGIRLVLFPETVSPRAGDKLMASGACGNAASGWAGAFGSALAL